MEYFCDASKNNNNTQNTSTIKVKNYVPRYIV